MVGNGGTDGVLDPLMDIADALISRPFDVDDDEGFASLPFLAVSRYSPLNLLGSENPQSPGARGGKWCDAFEDLMLASQGKPMREELVWTKAFGEAMGDHQKFMMTGHRFIQHLQTARLSDVFWAQQEDLRSVKALPASHRVGPARPAAVEETPRQVEKEETGPSTEQEMYGQFLSNITESGLLRAGIESSRGLIDYIEQRAMEANPNLQLESRNRKRVEDTVEGKMQVETQTRTSTASEPGVLSTMTTTEKTILPDGTVHSRVVLKKRFADGTVQVTESVDEQHGKGDEKDIKTENSDGKKKAGWFWN